MASCPECGAENPAGADFCCRCGAHVSAATISSVTCPHCNAQNPQGNAFCYSCGNPVHSNSVNPAPTARSVSYDSIPLPVGANVTGIIAMVCGIVSCVSCYGGFVPAIAAFILASISSERTPYGMSNSKLTVARITAGIGLGLSVISLIAYISLLSSI